MKFDEYKAEISSYIYMKLLTLNSNNCPSCYDQPSAGIIKWTLINSPETYSHASKFTKRISFMTLEGDTLLQIQKLWDSIFSSFFQSLSKKYIWPPYKSLRVEHHRISKFILPPDTYPKFYTAKENFECS